MKTSRSHSKFIQKKRRSSSRKFKIWIYLMKKKKFRNCKWLFLLNHLKNNSKHAVASFANFLHIIPWFAHNARWLFFANLAKVNGRNKKKDNLNVQAANRLSNLESLQDLNHNQCKASIWFAKILNAQRKINPWN